jgi:Family of unknown function (DUF6152)
MYPGRLIQLAALLAVSAVSAVATAHHSFAAIFDESHEYTIEGVLRKVDWINPHSYCYVTVKNADGTTTDWAFEGFPPAMMKRLGFSRDALVSNIGKPVKVQYNPAHAKGQPLGYGRVYEFPGGPRIVFTPPSN